MLLFGLLACTTELEGDDVGECEDDLDNDNDGALDCDDIGKKLEGWDGERWLDVRSEAVRAIMAARLDTAVSKSCDGVEPDNVDGYVNNSGFSLTESVQLDYNSFLATEAHTRRLSVGLKNAVELAGTLEPEFDWALNEECLTYSECGELAGFTAAGKAVFHTEYVDDVSDGAAKQAEVCGQASIAEFSTLIKTWDLDAWYLSCW
ncbi:MAG TPA: endo alpha-1,4 polygalactosaminidase [Myxococcota bacterium]|nr:endo alpha-1,4 polygalactosaminidase [Myxococcota bacterium]